MRETHRSPTVLLVEDDDGLRFGLQAILAARGYRVVEARRCDEAVRAASSRPDVVVLDYELPDGNAIDLMSRLRAEGVEGPYVILTGYGTIPLAVEAVKRGAHEFLTKPIEGARLARVIAESLGPPASPEAAKPSVPTPSQRTLWEVERQALLEALVLESGRVGRAAKRLNIPRSTIYLKIRAHDIDVDQIREAALAAEPSRERR